MPAQASSPSSAHVSSPDYVECSLFLARKLVRKLNYEFATLKPLYQKELVARAILHVSGKRNQDLLILGLDVKQAIAIHRFKYQYTSCAPEQQEPPIEGNHEPQPELLAQA